MSTVNIDCWHARDANFSHPLTSIPEASAFSATCRALSNPSLTLQLIFALLKPSEALTKTATSLTPCLIAVSSPLTLGTRTGNRILSSLSKPVTVALVSKISLSANCGIAFGETIEVTSILFNPASCNRFISWTLVAVGTTSRIFCRPSRGPTSTRRTLSLMANGLMRRQ